MKDNGPFCLQASEVLWDVCELNPNSVFRKDIVRNVFVNSIRQYEYSNKVLYH